MSELEKKIGKGATFKIYSIIRLPNKFSCYNCNFFLTQHLMYWKYQTPICGLYFEELKKISEGSVERLDICINDKREFRFVRGNYEEKAQKLANKLQHRKG